MRIGGPYTSYPMFRDGPLATACAVAPALCYFVAGAYLALWKVHAWRLNRSLDLEIKIKAH